MKRVTIPPAPGPRSAKRRSLYDVTHTKGVPAVTLPSSSELAQAAWSDDPERALPALLDIYAKLAADAEAKGFKNYAERIRLSLQDLSEAREANALDRAALTALRLGGTIQQLKDDAQYAEFAYQGWRRAEGMRRIRSEPTKVVRRKGRAYTQTPISDDERQRVSTVFDEVYSTHSTKVAKYRAVARRVYADYGQSKVDRVRGIIEGPRKGKK